MNRAQIVERTYLAERVWNRLHRVVADLPRMRASSELDFRARRHAFRPELRDVEQDSGILRDLKRYGIAVTTVEELGLGSVFEVAQPLARELLAVDVPPDLPATHLAADRLATRPEIFRWGASDRVLDLMEAYFEVPVAYHGVYVRRDMAVDRSQASNRWHLDMEDRRVIKLVVYLTDVEDGDGSFQYLPLEQSLELRRALGTKYHMGPNENMAQFVPEAEWCTANGPAGTVLVSDTALLYHKGRRPRHRDRATLFYDFTSRQPNHAFYCKASVPRPVLEEMSQGLSARALQSVFWRPRLKSFDPVKHEG